MRKVVLLLPICGIFAYLTLSSHISGQSGNCTGSPSAQTGCGSCHGSSATTGITVAFELDSAGTPVTRYKPGMAYTLKVTGTNTTLNNLPKFGFQLAMVMGTGTTQAGTFGTMAAGQGTHGSGTLTIVGQTSALATSTGTGSTNSTYTYTVNWTAPVAGSGTVTAYSVINAVNGDGRDASSDKWNTGSASFTELPAAANTSAATIDLASFSMYPNPVADALSIQFSQNGAYQIAIVDLNGHVMHTEVFEAGNNAMATTLNTANWAKGMYYVTVLTNGLSKTSSVVKL